MDKERRRGGVNERRGGGGGGEDEEQEENPTDEVKQVVRSKSGSSSSSSSSSPPGEPQTPNGSSAVFPDVTHSQKDASGRFINPWPTWNYPSHATFLFIFMMEKNHSNVPRSKKVLNEELPILEPFFVRSPESVGSVGSGLRVTWLGHASVLVEMDGLVILTDPIFSQRASPVQFLGYKRYRNPPCSVDQLPRLDVVLISHTHYDHLDLATVKALNRRFGADLHWLVPLGALNWMRRRGCQNVTQLDWWEKTCIPGHEEVTFVCTPAQHWCKRTLLDDNRALWGSWSVLGPSRRFFFGGDTGYCSSFQEIGRHFGPFDLAAIPIGAYLPRRIMCSQHVDPEEAVKIHIDVKAKHSLAIHWGTFALSYEYYLEPPVKLRQAMEQQGRDPAEFFTLNHGESRLLNNNAGTKF